MKYRLKKLFAMMLAIAMILSMTTLFASAAQTSEVKIQYNGQILETTCTAGGLFKENHLYVPFRAIFEAMGYTVSWYDEYRYAEAVKEDATVIVFPDDPDHYIINYILPGSDSFSFDYLDRPTYIDPDLGLTYVDAWSLGDLLNMNFGWDEENNTLIIVDNQYLLQKFTDRYSFETYDAFVAFSSLLDGTYAIELTNKTLLDGTHYTGTVSGLLQDSELVDLSVDFLSDSGEVVNGKIVGDPRSFPMVTGTGLDAANSSSKDSWYALNTEDFSPIVSSFLFEDLVFSNVLSYGLISYFPASSVAEYIDMVLGSTVFLSVDAYDSLCAYLDEYLLSLSDNVVEYHLSDGHMSMVYTYDEIDYTSVEVLNLYPDENNKIVRAVTEDVYTSKEGNKVYTEIMEYLPGRQIYTMTLTENGEVIESTTQEMTFSPTDKEVEPVYECGDMVMNIYKLPDANACDLTIEKYGDLMTVTRDSEGNPTSIRYLNDSIYYSREYSEEGGLTEALYTEEEVFIRQNGEWRYRVPMTGETPTFVLSDYGFWLYDNEYPVACYQDGDNIILSTDIPGVDYTQQEYITAPGLKTVHTSYTFNSDLEFQSATHTYEYEDEASTYSTYDRTDYNVGMIDAIKVFQAECETLDFIPVAVLADYGTPNQKIFTYSAPSGSYFTIYDGYNFIYDYFTDPDYTQPFDGYIPENAGALMLYARTYY